MNEEEINKLLYKFNNEYVVPNLTNLFTVIEGLREDAKREREELLMRAVNAETKLKMYEGLFSKLNLNLEVKNE